MAPRRPQSVTERDVIGAVAALGPAQDPRVEVGIGDDCAVLRTNPDPAWRQLVTTDLLVEGVHFDLRYMRLDDVGWKALAVSVSDIAAMGGLSRYALGQLGVPPATPPRQLAQLLDGVDRCARQYGVGLVGGDTVQAPQWTVGFTLLGEGRAPPLVRRGARPGDQVWHAGALGNSQVGLHLLWGSAQGATPLGRAAWARQARQAHCRPEPRTAESAMLRDWQATAAMDTSDSLAQCALQLAAASGVGLRLDFRRYAFAPAVPAFARACRKLAGPLTGAAAFSVPAAYTPENSPQTYGGLAHFVLASAEDYALLFTAPPHQQASLAQAPCGLQQLGQVVPAADGCTYLDETGRELPLENFGWQHL